MNIEELAFKDRKILANLNAVDLLNIIEFLQDDRRQCLEELSKTHNRSVEIQKENQELKSQLAGTTHCFDEEEHEKLKKQLEELKEEKQEWINLLAMFKNQQKEFIKYLEDEKDRLARECSNIYEDSLGHTRLVNEDKFNEVNDILQKYKEIIGDDK